MRFVYIVLVGFWICVAATIGCESVSITYDDENNGQNGTPASVGGGQSGLLHLPFASGTAWLCTQGANGSFSHTANCTKFDLDFDTSNTEDQELYAPVSGIVYVFDAIQTSSSFGNHICIDRGDGTYVVVAHMKRIDVCNGCEVAAGQMIGIEGCTGACTGDHVHIGLHEGDATLPAENGVSIEATYLVDDQSRTSSEFVCGTGGKEDPLGQSYTSLLPVARAHPNGTLVITTHNPKVYLLSGGEHHWILNEQVFWSRGYDFNDLVLISDEELNCYPEGLMIGQVGLIEAVTDSSGAMWLVVGANGDPDRYRMTIAYTGWRGVLESWGLGYTLNNPPAVVGWEHPYLSGWPVMPGTARFREGSLIKEASSSAVYVASLDAALPIKNWETYLLLGFAKRPIVLVEDGVIAFVQQHVGNCTTGTHCLELKTVNSCENGTWSAPEGEGQGGPISEPAPQPISQSEPPVQPSQPQESPSSEPQQQPQSQPQAQPVNVSTVCPSGALACLADENADGKNETLLMADHLWTATMLQATPAYVYANGGCFGGALTTDDLVSSVNGYYRIDFSKFAVDCTSQLTLVSTLGVDGAPPKTDMSNWLWWQGAGFCSQGSSLCQLVNNNTSWEEWLLSIAWHPQTGLVAAGNGLTSNSQF